MQSSMIICDARTGSNLLGYSLDGHQDIKYGDEILSSSIQCIPDIGRRYAQKQMINLKYERILTREKRNILATPQYLDYMLEHFNLVKLLYYHIPNELIGYIEQFPGKIIHLKRASLLDKCVSWFIAQRDDGFLYKRRPPRKEQIYIDISKLDYYLNRMIFQQQMWDDIFSGKTNVKTIYYHEMIDDWIGTLNSCQSFLNIPVRSLRKKTWQAIQCPNIELVKNKHEVLEYMKDYEEYI